MGRTYSFEPFLAQQPAQTYKGSGPRLGNDEHKIALTKEQEKEALPEAPTRHPPAHAETVKRYQARAAKKRTAAKTPASATAKKASASAPAKSTPRQASARKVTTGAAATKATSRQAQAAPEAKTSTKKKMSVAGLVGTLGRKVVGRAAAAAKKTVARAVKTATARKPAKKR